MKRMLSLDEVSDNNYYSFQIFVLKSKLRRWRMVAFITTLISVVVLGLLLFETREIQRGSETMRQAKIAMMQAEAALEQDHADLFTCHQAFEVSQEMIDELVSGKWPVKASSR